MRALLNIIKTIIFLIILVFLLNVTSKIFVPSWQYEKLQGQMSTLKGFYQLKKDSVDLMMIGDSALYKAISPVEIYNETGIISYNYSVSSARMYTFYYQLLEVLKYQSPELVIISPTTFFYNDKESEPEQRKSFDYLKLDDVKIKMINDDVFENDFEKKISLVFPILRYHDRFNKITLKDIKASLEKDESPTRGFMISNKYYPNPYANSYMKSSNDLKTIPRDYMIEYLDKINTLCNERQIKLLVVIVPDTKVWSMPKHISLKQILSEKNIDFLDLNVEDTKIDWLIDTEDEGSHFNILGAEKLSKFLGNYLVENYNLKDRRGNSNYKFMNDTVTRYSLLKQKHKKTLINKIRNNKIDH